MKTIDTETNGFALAMLGGSTVVGVGAIAFTNIIAQAFINALEPKPKGVVRTLMRIGATYISLKGAYDALDAFGTFATATVTGYNMCVEKINEHVNVTDKEA